MTKSKFYLITLLTAILLSVVLGSSSSFASDTSSTSQAELEPTISVPVSQWNELKSNNEKALKQIEASNVPLTEAQTIAVKQRQELNEAHNTINKLENELTQAKLQSMKQEVTLSEMSSSLIELKGQIENDKKTIKRLRMQRNLSQILGAGATIGIAIRG